MRSFFDAPRRDLRLALPEKEGFEYGTRVYSYGRRPTAASTGPTFQLLSSDWLRDMRPSAQQCEWHGRHGNGGIGRQGERVSIRLQAYEATTIILRNQSRKLVATARGLGRAKKDPTETFWYEEQCGRYGRRVQYHCRTVVWANLHARGAAMAHGSTAEALAIAHWSLLHLVKNNQEFSIAQNCHPRHLKARSTCS